MRVSLELGYDKDVIVRQACRLKSRPNLYIEDPGLGMVAASSRGVNANTDSAAALAKTYKKMPGMTSIVRALAKNGFVEFDQTGGLSKSACERDAQHSLDDGICTEFSREIRPVRAFMSSSTLVIRVEATDLALQVAAILAA